MNNANGPKYIYKLIVLLFLATFIVMAIMLMHQTREKYKAWNKWRTALFKYQNEHEEKKNLEKKSIGEARIVKTTEEEESQDLSKSFYTRRQRPKRIFCIVTGGEGTGSTWMTRMLPSDHVAPFNTHRGVTEVIHRLWSSGPTQVIQQSQKNLGSDLSRVLPAKSKFSVLHVSAPDYDAHHYPDLNSQLWSDIYAANFTFALIVMVRNPMQAAHSNYRRKVGHLLSSSRRDIAHSARSTEMHYTLLSEQVRHLRFPGDVLVVNYHEVMSNPDKESLRIAKYLQLSPEKTALLKGRIRASRKKSSDYKENLQQFEVDFLQQFFNDERCAKWKYLWNRSFQ
jgi:hypothetical protein